MFEKILKQKALLNTILFAVVIGGLFAYLKVGKLEDAEIPIKSAVVITIYPGATAHEVELEVTDVLEKAIQKLENIDNISSRSLPGYSEITINIEQGVVSKDVPQLWDHLRRKVDAAKTSLPQGAHDPIVNDDFGDVYGIFVAVTADGYEYSEFNDYVDFLRREFLEVEGIKRIELFGLQTESVDISFSSEELAGLSINPMMIVQAMNDQGSIVNPGSIISGTERIRLSVGQKFSTIDEIENVLVQVPGGGSFRLGDIAEVNRSFYEPKQEGLIHNGDRAISMAMSMESGVNVIDVGDLFDAKLASLDKELPVGIEIHSVYSQPERVQDSINGFIINLIESVLIVIVILLIAMGMRSGLLIASGLVFTILATFIVMLVTGLELQRISLGAIIVAMGMLVDNSIVIADGILIDLKRGVDRKKVFTASAKRTALPLLGATVIAILAFLPLAMSPGGAGEYMKSLFYVLAISLFLSWIFAMIQTPFMAANFYKNGIKKSKKGESKDPYDSKFYKMFKQLIQYVLMHKRAFTIGSVLVLFLALYSFKFVKFQFMPFLDNNQFIIEYKLPKGSDINSVEKDLTAISKEIIQWDEIDQVTGAVGRTPARYSLMRPMATQDNSYGELIVDSKDYETSLIAGDKILDYVSKNYPHANIRKRVYGPIFTEYEIEVMFTGPDPDILRDLAEQAKTIMRNEPTATAVNDNWKNKVKVLTPEYSVEQARQVGISRSDMANAMAIGSDGLIVGAMMEGNSTLPIKLKLNESISENVEKLTSLPIWGMYSQSSVPLGQVAQDIKIKWENDEVYRYDGERAIRAQCDPVQGVLTSDVEAKLKLEIDQIELPHGYTMEWKGSSESSSEAQSNLLMFLPLALGLMLMIVLALFNNLKQSLIIFIIFPFALVGIVIGFITTGATLTFIGIIGSLGLIGMMIKNAIVLIDEINQNLKSGKTQLKSIIMATISRLRPVVMASATTILGMIPLLFDVMYQSLAIVIVFGLLFGTVITLLVIPVIYAIMFKVDISPILKTRELKK
jgi:multidrug efflux pump subunit AcrB